MTEEPKTNGSLTTRLGQVEGEVGSLKGEVGSLKTEFKVLGNTVKSLSDDIAASDRKQDAFHSEWRHQKDDERKQRDAERRSQDEFVRSRQMTPRDVVVIMAAVVTTLGAIAAVGNYVMDTKVNGAVSPMSARQDGASQSILDMRGSVERALEAVGELKAKDAERERVTSDNRAFIADLRERLRGNEVAVALQDERIKAEAELRKAYDEREAALREAAIDDTRDELRMFNARVPEH